MRKIKMGTTIWLVFILICLLIVIDISFFYSSRFIEKNETKVIIGGVSPLGEHVYITTDTFLGRSSQSIRCNQNGNSLTEENAIQIDMPEGSKLINNVDMDIFLLVTCGDPKERTWRIKVNGNKVHESWECFEDWKHLSINFDSSYLNKGSNSVSVECDPISSGSYYISFGKRSDSGTEFMKTTYTYS